MTSPARPYLFVSGCFLLLVGVVGVGPDSWPNLAATGLGLASLVVATVLPGLSAAVTAVSGVANAGIFVLFATSQPAMLLIASNAADQLTHAALAIGGLTVGGLELQAARHVK